jgi:nucleoid-associated protein YgaU
MRTIPEKSSLVVPLVVAVCLLTAGCPKSPATVRIHVIKRGDTLWKVSEMYYGDGRRWKNLVVANPGLDPAAMVVGQTIKIQPLSTSSTQSGALDVAAPDPVVAAGERVYVVREGDNGFWGISKSQYGHSKYFPAIANRNPDVNPARLIIGQKLILPSLEQAKAFLANSYGGANVSPPE